MSVIKAQYAVITDYMKKKKIDNIIVKRDSFSDSGLQRFLMVAGHGHECRLVALRFSGVAY